MLRGEADLVDVPAGGDIRWRGRPCESDLSGAAAHRVQWPCEAGCWWRHRRSALAAARSMGSVGSDESQDGGSAGDCGGSVAREDEPARRSAGGDTRWSSERAASGGCVALRDRIHLRRPDRLQGAVREGPFGVPDHVRHLCSSTFGFRPERRRTLEPESCYGMPRLRAIAGAPVRRADGDIGSEPDGASLRVSGRAQRVAAHELSRCGDGALPPDPAVGPRASRLGDQVRRRRSGGLPRQQPCSVRVRSTKPVETPAESRGHGPWSIDPGRAFLASSPALSGVGLTRSGA